MEHVQQTEKFQTTYIIRVGPHILSLNFLLVNNIDINNIDININKQNLNSTSLSSQLSKSKFNFINNILAIKTCGKPWKHLSH